MSDKETAGNIRPIMAVIGAEVDENNISFLKTVIPGYPMRISRIIGTENENDKFIGNHIWNICHICVEHQIELFFRHADSNLIGNINQSFVNDICGSLHNGDFIGIFIHAQLGNHIADIGYRISRLFK